MSEAGAKRTKDQETVLSVLARFGRPPKVGELVTALRSSGVTRNPGGLLLGMVAEGLLVMDEDRKLLATAELLVA